MSSRLQLLSSRAKRAICCFFALSLNACGVFGPDGGRSFTIELPFCGAFSTTLSWAAVKKGGDDWTYLTPNKGLASFEAKGPVTVAYGNPFETRVYSATADELSQVKCFRQRPETKLLEGNVRDVPADERFHVTVGPVTVMNTPFAAFIGDGPVDIVARTEKASTGVPSRVIVRHDVDLPTGSEIPNLDFASTEARPFVSANATVSGSPAGAFGNDFWPRGNVHTLRFGAFEATPFQHFAVPEALLGPDDYHTLTLRDFFQNAGRELIWYYRRARGTTLTMGPPANTPIGALITQEPCARLQARVASQPQYPSFALAQFFVNMGQSNQTIVEVGVSRDFLGETPATWTLETPDLRSAEGSCIVRPFPNSWSVTVAPQEGRIALHLGARGRDGEVRRFSIGSWSSP